MTPQPPPPHLPIIQINGGFGKVIAAVVVGLLILGVGGIWNMSGTQAEILTHIKWIMQRQLSMGEDVKKNTSRLDRLGRISPFAPLQE